MKPNYTFSDETIHSQDLIAAFPEAFVVLTIPNERLSHRVKAEELIALFKARGYEVRATHPLITFERHFGFDITPITQKLRAYYLTHYPSLQIDALHVRPRSYMAALPQEYTIEIPLKSYRQEKGTLYLQTPDKKRYFFNFELNASLKLLASSQLIKRHEKLTPFNTHSITKRFEGFIAPPLQALPQDRHLRAKIRLIEGRIITERDVEPMPLVLRGMSVNVRIRSAGMSLELRASAEDEGGLYDMITVKKSDGETLRARVVGPASVEIE